MAIVVWLLISMVIAPKRRWAEAMGGEFRRQQQHIRALTEVANAAAAILRPARGDAPWLHTAEFDDLRAALKKAGF